MSKQTIRQVTAQQIVEMDDEELFKTDIVQNGVQEGICSIAKRVEGWEINGEFYHRLDMVTIAQ